MKYLRKKLMDFKVIFIERNPWEDDFSLLAIYRGIDLASRVANQSTAFAIVYTVVEFYWCLHISVFFSLERAIPHRNLKN